MTEEKEELWCKECGRSYQDFSKLSLEEICNFLKELENKNEISKFLLKHVENKDKFHILFPNGKPEFVTKENIHEE